METGEGEGETAARYASGEAMGLAGVKRIGRTFRNRERASGEPLEGRKAEGIPWLGN